MSEAEADVLRSPNSVGQSSSPLIRNNKTPAVCEECWGDADPRNR